MVHLVAAPNPAVYDSSLVKIGRCGDGHLVGFYRFLLYASETECGMVELTCGVVIMKGREEAGSELVRAIVNEPGQARQHSEKLHNRLPGFIFFCRDNPILAGTRVTVPNYQSSLDMHVAGVAERVFLG